jgi:hypothetical protein
MVEPGTLWGQDKSTTWIRPSPTTAVVGQRVSGFSPMPPGALGPVHRPSAGFRTRVEPGCGGAACPPENQTSWIQGFRRAARHWHPVHAQARPTSAPHRGWW